MKVYQLIFHMMLDQITYKKTYDSQDDIAKEAQKYYKGKELPKNLKITQSAISKAMGRLSGIIEYQDKYYTVKQKKRNTKLLSKNPLKPFQRESEKYYVFEKIEDKAGFFEYRFIKYLNKTPYLLYGKMCKVSDYVYLFKIDSASDLKKGHKNLISDYFEKNISNYKKMKYETLLNEVCFEEKNRIKAHILSNELTPLFPDDVLYAIYGFNDSLVIMLNNTPDSISIYGPVIKNCFN
jgi:hypothetical protein